MQQNRKVRNFVRAVRARLTDSKLIYGGKKFFCFRYPVLKKDIITEIIERGREAVDHVDKFPCTVQISLGVILYRHFQGSVEMRYFSPSLSHPLFPRAITIYNSQYLLQLGSYISVNLHGKTEGYSEHRRDSQWHFLTVANFNVYVAVV